MATNPTNLGTDHSSIRPQDLENETQCVSPPEDPASDVMATSDMSPHILVVDDDGASCAQLIYILEHDGHLVARAASGASAIAYLRNHLNTSMVFLDLDGPRTDGYEFLRLRATFDSLHNIPVVVMANEPVALEQAVNHAILTKPARMQQLRELVRMALGMCD